MKLETQNSYITNPQFVGGLAVTPASTEDFADFTADNPQFGFVAGGLYVGAIGDVTIKTVDNSVFTLVEAYGFIPGIIVGVSTDGTTADGIIALK